MARPSRRDVVAPAAVALAAAAVRWPGLHSELWLDEVWSVNLARGARTFGAVLFDIHHDNSTPLNALWLRLVAGTNDWAAFRALSLACGLLTVALLADDPEDRPRGLLTGALAALCAPMVLYATEARGYASMALCAVLCRRLLAAPGRFSPARAAAFALSAALGMFSHPTFVYALAALGVWAAATLPRGERLRLLFLMLVPPAAAYGLYLLFQTEPMTFGAGAHQGFGAVVFHALAQWSGAPDSGLLAPAGAAGAACVATLCLGELARLRRERDPEFYFYAALIAGAAAFVAAFPFRYERHFFVCLPFALILAARALTRMLRGSPRPRAAAAVLLALFLAGNAVRLRALALDGRGRYREAVARIARDTAGPEATVGSDHDFRNKMLLDFYAPAASPAKRLRYVTAAAWSAGPPEWYLHHLFSRDPRSAPIAIGARGGPTYRFVEFYPYGGMSGWSWALYHREDAASAE